MPQTIVLLVCLAGTPPTPGLEGLSRPEIVHAATPATAGDRAWALIAHWLGACTGRLERLGLQRGEGA